MRTRTVSVASPPVRRGTAKKLRILVLMDADLIPPARAVERSEAESAAWRTEYDVTRALQKLGHDVRPLGVSDDLPVIRDAIAEWKPDIHFNLLEEFAGCGVLVHHVVSYLELLRQRYTGCNPRGIMLAQDKGLAKKLLSYHRVRVPDFEVFPRGRTVRRPRRLAFPLLVKSLTVEGSVGIAQASLVYDDAKLVERVRFIHEQTQTDAIATQYIEGRELYVGVLGNRRLETLPVWELLFEKFPDDAPRFATEKAKWDRRYQIRHGIKSQAARDLSADLQKKITHICKRAYRVLSLSGYARIDLRLQPNGDVYVLEANPNPQLARGEDLAASAEQAGRGYLDLIQHITDLGTRYRADWHV